MENRIKKYLILIGVLTLILVGLLVYIKYSRSNSVNEKLIKYKNDLTYVYASDNYEIYELNCKNKNKTNKELYENCFEETKKLYYTYDVKKDILYTTYAMHNFDTEEDSKFYYIFVNNDSEEILGIINLKNKTLITGYEDYSCGFHSDVSSRLCLDNKTTILKNNSKFGVYSLITDKLIIPIEYDTINNVVSGKYLVEKNGKYGLLDDNMKYIINLEYDYIGYNEYIGYILIKNGEISLYDTNMKSIEINKLDGLYQTALSKEEDLNFVTMQNSNSYYWFSGSYLMKINIKNQYNFDSDGENYFKYTGTKFSGEKLIIFDQYAACNEKAKIYVIDDNKAYAVNSNELEVKPYCF